MELSESLVGEEMQWKVEPESPESLDEDSLALEGVELELWLGEEGAGDRAATADKLLRDLDLLVHPDNEDEFGAWLEQKGEVPVVFEDVLVEGGCYYGGTGQLHNVEELLQQQQHVTPTAPPAVATHPGDAVLLKEFEYVLQGGVAPPTPPRSPPSHHDLLTIIQELDGSSGNELDELVASRVESFYPESIVGSVGYPSPRSSGESSCGGSSPPPETSDSDPEWCTPPSRGGGSGGPLRRRRGGATPVDERRRRKKEQNKNAATRYRMKKKAEAEGIKDEEKELKERNTQLHDQVTDIAREIRYLKGLMRDVFRAKGLIS